MFNNQETEKRIEDLLSKMTLKEKIGQLYQVGLSPVGGFEISVDEATKMYEDGRIDEKEYYELINNAAADKREDMIREGMIGSFIGIKNADHANRLQKIAVEESRLGIPMIFGLDVIHGHRTIFPIPLAEACSWDTSIYEKSAEIAAREASEDGIHWTFAPMIDIARDPRWGRISEGVGEDTLIATDYAYAKVKGFQGENLSEKGRIVACPKHLAAYGACEGGRDYNTVDMSLPKLYETYLPPFEAAVKAGAGTVMCSFNDLNGVPCTTNRFLLKTVLREQMGFKGFVISDATAIKECVNHGTAQNEAEAAEQSIKAGTDMDMGSEYYTNNLEQLLDEGRVDINDIDDAVRNILRVKFEKGLFEKPYFEKPEKSSILCDEHRVVALEAARKSIVLLKNSNKALPINKEEKIAVVGSFADDGVEIMGCWIVSGRGEDSITLIDALKNRNVDFKFAPCMSRAKNSYSVDFEELNNAISDVDTVIAVVGEHYYQTGEANSKSDLSLKGDQEEMLVRIKQSGKKLITVLFNGRPLIMPKAIAVSDAILETWYLGSEGGNAIADVIFGDYNPSGRLTVTFPQNSGCCPTYYSHTNTGRPAGETMWSSKYRDCPHLPVYPFGYGLSYTEYNYSNLKLSVNGDVLVVSVDVTNVGDFSGEETVQIYTHRHKAKRVRPVKELKGYKKVYLEPKETKTVTVNINKKDLGYYDAEMNFVTDESVYDVWAAHDSSCGLCGKIEI